MLRKAVLFFLLLYVVDDIHFKLSTGIPGVAPINIIFGLALLLVRKDPDPIVADHEPILKKGLYVWFGVLTFALLWAQLRAGRDFIADLTYYKNAIFYPLFYFLYLRCRADTKTIRWLIIWVMTIAAVAGLEAIREGLDYGIGKYNPLKRASGPFGDDWRQANVAGVFYAMFVPMFVAFALFLKKGQAFWRLAAIGGIVCLAGGTLFTYSRQSYFIILFGTTVLLMRKGVAAALVIGALLVSLIGFLPDTVTQRVDETKQESKRAGGGEEVDESTASRWEIWAGALQIAAHNPIGVGLDRFKQEIGNYSSHKGMDAHNFYVRTLAEYGPQGVFALFYLIYHCLLLGSFLRKEAKDDDPDAQALAWGFTVTTLATCMGNIYGSRFLDGAVMAPYWALGGLCERYALLKRHAAATEGGANVTAREPTLEERFPLAAYIRGRR